MMLIKIIKLFITVTLVSSFVVWLSNNPGTVEIIWQNYLIETDLFGLTMAILFLIFSVLLFNLLFSSIKNIPKDFRYKKNIKNLSLTNLCLDNIAEALLIGDYENIEKNSRKLKKFLNNDFFSVFMLFNSSLIKNDLEKSRKYLKIMESIPRAKYISKRAKIILLIKENKKIEVKEELLKTCKEYPGDHWFHDKLSRIYALEENWKLAHDSIDNLKSLPFELRNNLADLKILTGESPIDAFKLSDNSIQVVKETIKFYINQNDLKRAINVVERTWMNLLCLEIIEVFMKFKCNDEKNKLKRYKLVSKVLKKNIDEKSNETKLALAFASYEASIWGESQNFLEKIQEDEWDERVIDLYKKISDKTSKAKQSISKFKVLPKPKWRCVTCEHQEEKWQLFCTNCSSIGSLIWSKSKIKKERNSDFFKDFLQNPLGHFPKMKREN